MNSETDNNENFAQRELVILSSEVPYPEELGEPNAGANFTLLHNDEIEDDLWAAADEQLSIVGEDYISPGYDFDEGELEIIRPY